jgi:DAK2 domain fusion protein YloV
MSAAITAKMLVRAANYGADWLGVFREEVNALNVYPVPDGDTGTNMYLTLESMTAELKKVVQPLMPPVAEAIAYGSLLGARGNSGVILSQLLKGFAEIVKELDRATAADLGRALQRASEVAYGAVMKPVEGTILTVARHVGEGASKVRSTDPVRVLVGGWSAGQEALARTPDLLPVLKEAGVVDAGGKGYLYFLEGIIAHFEGRPLPPPPEVTHFAAEQFESTAFGYCTEFLLEADDSVAKRIEEEIAPLGDSLLVVAAAGRVKGHIHTEDPDRLLALVARHGRMIKTKVEDMSAQHSEILTVSSSGEIERPNLSVVAVATGDGIVRAFRSLGARVVGGGQTLNPSVHDIAAAALSCPSDNVVVLPNNRNVILAAERANEVVAEKRLVVIPTTTLGQGLAAAMAFDAKGDVDATTREMKQSASAVTTIEVTVASRAAEVGGVKVREGDLLGLVDDVLAASGTDPERLVRDLVGLHLKDREIITIFHGPKVEPEVAERLAGGLREAHDGVEVELHDGGPDLYHYVVSIE